MFTLRWCLRWLSTVQPQNYNILIVSDKFWDKIVRDIFRHFKYFSQVRPQPYYNLSMHVLNSVFLFTFRGYQAKTGKRVTENISVSGGPEMLPRLSKNAPQVRVRELTWSSGMKLFLFVPDNGKYTFKMINLRKTPITPTLSSYLHDRHL